MSYVQSVYLELITRQSFVYTKCISVCVYLNSPIFVRQEIQRVVLFRNICYEAPGNEHGIEVTYSEYLANGLGTFYTAMLLLESESILKSKLN